MATSIYNALFAGTEATRLTPAIINATAATLAVTQATHAGAIITLNRAGGIAVALPAATGSGAIYTFLNMTALSAASHVFTKAGSDTMVGIISIGKAAGQTTPFLSTANSVITMNATTSGGLSGDILVLIDQAAAVWFVEGSFWGSGTLVTPFS